tara:strand:- start:8894 stop:9304 length:411 start_codon:yes stop_codon:yes gene_type:complete
MSSKKVSWGTGKVEFTVLWPEIKRCLDRGQKVVDVYEELVGKNRLTMKIQTFYTHCRQARNGDDRSDTTNVEKEAAATKPRTVPPSDRTPLVSESLGEGAKIIRAAAPRGVKDLRAAGEDLLAAADEENPNGEYDG